MITCRANQLAKELGLLNWKASKGWFYRWRQRNNVMLRTSLASALEPVEHEANSLTAGLAEFREVLANYSHSTLFHLSLYIYIYLGNIID